MAENKNQEQWLYDLIGKKYGFLNSANMQKLSDEERKRVEDKMSKYWKNHDNESTEFLVNGAVLSCADGSKLAKLNTHISNETLKKNIENSLSEYPRKLAKSVLEDVIDLPNSLIELISSGCFDLSKKSANLKALELKKVIEQIKSYQVEVKKLERLKYSTVCSGGVPVESIDGKSMGLKSDNRVKVIGEALDVVGKSGGYNLQFAFSSAIRAVKNK